jgi:hypothetical protein
MNIRRVRTSRGCRSVLTYWYRGVRYRPVLGLNLTGDQEREAALEIISAIHANTAQHAMPSSSVALEQVRTFSELILTYSQFMRAKRRDADHRNEAALRLHLMPFLGRRCCVTSGLKIGWPILNYDVLSERQKGPLSANVVC